MEDSHRAVAKPESRGDNDVIAVCDSHAHAALKLLVERQPLHELRTFSIEDAHKRDGASIQPNDRIGLSVASEVGSSNEAAATILVVHRWELTQYFAVLAV